MCGQEGAAWFCAHATGGDELLAELWPNAFRPDDSQVDAPDWEAMKRIEACRYRVSTCGCLSKAATCVAMGYPATTDYAACLACVTQAGRN